MAPVLSGSRMWAVIAGAVAYHELACREGQLLSEVVDRALDKGPVSRLLVTLAVGVTAGHLLNLLPPKLDPYQWVYCSNQRVRGKQ